MLVCFAACDKAGGDEPGNKPVIIAATGNIEARVNEFRNILGAQLNTTPGQTSGRREINWDAVPDQFATQRIPSDFFNPTNPGASPSLQRGFKYAADADARISSNAFSDIETTNGNEFSAFSGNKTFTAVSSNLWHVEFEVAGQSRAASVNGFGAVFSDVDNAGSTTMEFFAGTRSLGVFEVPEKTTGTHSFLGVYFPGEKVTRVVIRQGNAVIANGVKDVSSGGTNDLVIMDDFLYDEPKAIE